MYIRAVRALKTIYEALQRLKKLNVFEHWLQILGKGQHLDDYLESDEFTTSSNKCQPDHMVNAADWPAAFFQLWEEYEDEIRPTNWVQWQYFGTVFWRWWKLYWIA